MFFIVVFIPLLDAIFGHLFKKGGTNPTRESEQGQILYNDMADRIDQPQVEKET